MSADDRVLLDGSSGEGGGQILRTALTLSMLTARPFRMERIRANRERPGLQPQHLTAVRAAARVCSACVTGAEKGSATLEFAPGPIAAGRFDFDIGTAGSITLLVHTLAYPLALAPGASQVTLVGGTHVPFSPGYHDLELGWAPWLAAAGLAIRLSLVAPGFYPAGGGELHAEWPGDAAFVPVQAAERGALKRLRVLSGVGSLALSIADRQRDRAVERLQREAARGTSVEVTGEVLPYRSRSPGTFVTLVAEFASGPVTFTALGQRGKPAERVADEACDALLRFLAGSGVVDGHLADQLVLPMALARGESLLRIAEVTPHLTTQLDVVRRFLEIRCSLEAPAGESALLAIGR